MSIKALEQQNHFEEAELRYIPEEWEVVRLGRMASFTKRPRGLLLPTDNIPFIPMALIPNNRVSIESYITKSPTEIRSGVYCEKGDLLLPRITPCFENGKQGLLDKLPTNSAFATTEVFPIKTNEDILVKLFVFYFLLIPNVRQDIAAKMEGTTGRQRIPKTVIENLPIPLPPLSEQEKIVRIFSRVQRSIEAQDKIISATRELKKSLMRHLFTYGPVSVHQIDKVILMETEVGQIPKNWGLVRLGEVYEFSKKPTGLKIDGQESIPFIPMELISESNKEIRGWQDKNISEISSGTFVLRDDLIVAKITPSFENGKQAILCNLPEDFGFATTEVWAIHPKNKRTCSEYLYNYLRMPQIRIHLASKMEGTTGRQRLPRHILENLLIPFPLLREQKKIVRTLSAVDAKIDKEEKKKRALESLFKSLLNNLMTGKIRVNNLEI